MTLAELLTKHTNLILGLGFTGIQLSATPEGLDKFETNVYEFIEDLHSNKVISKMMEFHYGQKDKLGNPYFMHPLRVACYIVHEFPDADTTTLMAALFHDVIEDCRHGQYLLEQFLPDFLADEVLNIVKILTKPSDVSYNDYMESILQHNNWKADLIKYMDLKDHLQNDNYAGTFKLPENQKAKYTHWLKIFGERLCLAN